ncbi:MAG: hypothetical protein KBT03_11130 [Bacteroidales bacterium]|nr:hypothetical protein [Candidatus Scybalousia scybalohippi]
MADNKKTMAQPSEEAERELLDVIDSTTETITIGGHKYKIKPLKKGTRIVVTRILLDSKGAQSDNSDEKEPTEDEMEYEDRVSAKCAAAYILNSWWSLYFMWGIVWQIYWRWLYYIRQYTESDYFVLFSVCKKKAEKQTQSYTMNIILQTAMKVTTMTMTRKEVKRSLQENRLAQLGVQQKNSQV